MKKHQRIRGRIISKMFFKYFFLEKFPSIKYEEILNELDIKYPKKIVFVKSKFFALKNEIYKES